MSDVYGPPLPPGFKLASSSNSDVAAEEKNTSATTFIGPQCPPEFLASKCKSHHSDESDKSGDESNNDHDDSDDDVYGPMPVDMKMHTSSFEDDTRDVVSQMEKRAENMKKKLKGPTVAEPEVLKREEWMTVPNTSSRNQLGAISRCLSHGTSDEKKRKREIEKETKKHAEKDKKISRELEKYNKSKRSKSLLEMHQKSRKKKEKDSSEPKERKPFDRDAELSLRFMTQDQKNSVISKSKLLDSRFKRGSSQYL